MSSLADALASLESANASISAISSKYPSEFPIDRTSRPIDLRSETSRLKREQDRLQETLTSENHKSFTRSKNFYVAPGGVLVNARWVPEPEDLPMREVKKASPKKTTHPQNSLVRVDGETHHCAESNAVTWLCERVLPLLPKQNDPTAVFGRTELKLETFQLDDDDIDGVQEKNNTVGGFFITDAKGAHILRVFLEVRETPSSEGPGTDRSYGSEKTKIRFGNEQWTFSRVNRCARVPGPSIVMLLGLNGEQELLMDEKYKKGQYLETEKHCNNLYTAWLVPKENALALKDQMKKYVYISPSDPTCKWRAFKVGSKKENQNTGAGIADVLTAHINNSTASRGQSVDSLKATPSGNTGETGIKPSTLNTHTGGSSKKDFLSKPARRAALLDALGVWSHSVVCPTQYSPGSAAPDMAPAHDGLPRPDFSLATLRMDYDMCVNFRVLHVAARVEAKPSWDIGTVTLRKPGRPALLLNSKSCLESSTASGGFNSTYSKHDFDLLFVHVGEASAMPGVFVIPISDLVARLAVLGEFNRHGQILQCDGKNISPDLRLMIPTHTSRWRGVKAPVNDGTKGQFVDAKGSWALEYWVPYPNSQDDVAGTVDEVKRLVLGEKPSWDGKWTHPAFRI